MKTSRLEINRRLIETLDLGRCSSAWEKFLAVLPKDERIDKPVVKRQAHQMFVRPDDLDTRLLGRIRSMIIIESFLVGESEVT